MILSDYLSLFPGTSREKPRFMALAEAVLRQAADLIPLAEQLLSGFSFASAEGVQLDLLGESIGIPRDGRTDEDYRAVLLAKLRLWTWDGTNEGTAALLAGMAPGASQRDNQDGTVTVSGGYMYPVAAGVRVVE